MRNNTTACPSCGKKGKVTRWLGLVKEVIDSNQDCSIGSIDVPCNCGDCRADWIERYQRVSVTILAKEEAEATV